MTAVDPVASAPVSAPTPWHVDLRSHPVMLAAGLAAVCVGLLGGWYVTAVGARRTGELALDVAISHHRGGIVDAVGLVMQVAFGPWVAPLVLVAVCLALWWRDRPAAVVTAVLTVVGWVACELAKLVFRRQRPPAGLVHPLVQQASTYSFPSGHTAFAAALVIALFVALRDMRRARAWIAGLGTPIVLLVAASRLVVGAHYLGDVVGSLLMASGIIVVFVAVGERGEQRLRVRLRRGYESGSPDR